jgi:hypothetical protein
MVKKCPNLLQQEKENEIRLAAGKKALARK